MSDGGSTVTIRNILRTDHDALVALWIDAWTLTMPQIRFVEREPFIRERLDAWSQSPRRGRIAEQKGQPAGFFLLDPATRDLEQICLAPAYWGSGIAATLLADARALSPAGIALSVNRDNPRAVAFYRQQGFHETGESISPYSGLPLIHMAWLPKR